MCLTNLHFENNSFKNFRNCVKDKKLVIMGAGGKGKATLKYILSITKVAYFVDNNPWKWNTSFEELGVFAPEILLNEDKEKTVVLIAIPDNVFTAEEQLLSLGIKYYFAFQMFFDKTLENFERGAICLML
jgi:FlaA1/EpsC-like NDP-sugar epimerase